MHGVTDYYFRNVYATYFTGIDLAISPFIDLLPGQSVKKSQIRGLLQENNERMPVIPQIMGNVADDFIFLATYLHDLGYDHINWNLGCPYRMVVKRKRGAGLLPHPELIEAFLEKVIPAIPAKLSIKLRLGLNSADEIEHVIPVLNRYPLTDVTIHPRIATQLYDGDVDMDAFERSAAQLNAPIVYNGDIVAVEGFQALRQRFPDINRWMIGRGVIRNPFLPALLKGVTIAADRQFEIFVEYHQALFETVTQVMAGPGHLLNKMKEYWSAFSESFENGRKVFKLIKKVNSVPAFQRATDEIFQKYRWLTGTDNTPS